MPTQKVKIKGKRPQGNMSNVERSREKQHLEALNRYMQALELRRAGATYSQIADTLGYATAAGAQKAVEAGIREVLQEPAQGVLELELSRLDAMLTTLWPKMRQGDMAATDRILRIMDRRARYLGLDAPERHEIGVHGTVDHEHHHVVIIGGDEREYMDALQEAVDALEAGTPKELANPNTAEEIVDAELVEDTGEVVEEQG